MLLTRRRLAVVEIAIVCVACQEGPLGVDGGLDASAGDAGRDAAVAQDAGRDPSSLDFAYSASWLNDQQAVTLPNGQRRPLTGTPQQIADDIKRYEDVGVHYLMVNLQGDTQAQSLERMQRFADRIMPLAA